jgi:hypothetical protein
MDKLRRYADSIGSYKNPRKAGNSGLAQPVPSPGTNQGPKLRRREKSVLRTMFEKAFPQK